MNARANFASKMADQYAIDARLDRIDWCAIEASLDERGCAQIEGLLSSDECTDVASLYARDDAFRSTIVMARHNFGRGEYRYFDYPLPALIHSLRIAGTHRCAPTLRFHATMHRSCVAAMSPASAVPRLYCCGMRAATTTACIRISMANTFSRCRSLFCCLNPDASSRAVSLS
jgi:hypothetical protein